MLGIIFWISVLLILYVYIGYPVLIFFLSKLRKSHLPVIGYQPTVTLIFAAHNEEQVIEKKIGNCLSLDYPREKLQILIADDGSTDQTVPIVKSNLSEQIKLLSHPTRRGKLATLNDAVKELSGEIILFSDADNFYPPNALTETVKYFSDPSVGAVSGGRNVIGDETALGSAEGIYWKYEEFIKRHESRFNSCVGVAGDLLAVRRDLYTPPPPNIINDDFYIALSVIKQGYRVAYAPEARSYHPVAASEEGEIERRARMVAGRYQAIALSWNMLPFSRPEVVWQVVSHKYLRPFIPFAMITALLVNVFALFENQAGANAAVLHLYNPYNWLFFWAQILFYSLAFLGMTYKFGGFFGKVLYLPTFLVNSNLAALRGFYRFITSKQTVTWKKAARL